MCNAVVLRNKFARECSFGVLLAQVCLYLSFISEGGKIVANYFAEYLKHYVASVRAKRSLYAAGVIYSE